MSHPPGSGAGPRGSRHGSRRKGTPTRVGDWVGRVLGELGLGEVSRAHRIGEGWAEAVGADVARHCRPVGLRGDVLEVEVESPVWAQQLQLRKPELLRALEATLGALAPRELHFQVGYRRRPTRGGSGPAASSEGPDAGGSSSRHPRDPRPGR